MTHSTATHFADPRTLYPQPEFKTQPQQPPGDEQLMQPAPDHGEKTYKGHGRLAGKVALISGGDSGIGKAVALAYAREGADIVFTYLCEDKDAQDTGRLVREAGREVISIKMNQANNRQACERAVAVCIEKFQRLDILVNNAAFQQTYDSLDAIPDDELSYTFQTNIEAFFHFSRAAMKHLPPGGSIINTASIQSFSPSRNLAPYAASKAAVASFTLSLAAEAINKGIRVNGVAPGPVWTPLIPTTMPDEKVINFGKNTLFGRPAQPAELAPVYVFLASAEASYVTGEIYGVTGGRIQM